MKSTARLTTIAVLLAGTFFASASLACTTDAWTSAEGITLADGPTNGVSRYSGICALEVTQTGHVVDNNPAAETTFIGRFYVFPKNLSAGTHELFVAFSVEGDTGSDVFVITYDGTDITLDAGAVGGGSVSVAADTTHWNLIEFKWVSGGQGSLWVNSDALTQDADGTFASGTGSIEQVRLGAVSGINTDKAYFDAYESHRSLPVGALLDADANGNGSISIADAITLFNELNLTNQTLATGQPDCNLNGSITIADAICLFNLL